MINTAGRRILKNLNETSEAASEYGSFLEERLDILTENLDKVKYPILLGTYEGPKTNFEEIEKDKAEDLKDQDLRIFHRDSSGKGLDVYVLPVRPACVDVFLETGAIPGIITVGGLATIFSLTTQTVFLLFFLYAFLGIVFSVFSDFRRDCKLADKAVPLVTQIA